MKLLIRVVVSLLFPLQVWCQSAQSVPPRRLKIGLALEGGGALGLAHLGLLEWFQKNHIPVDYIAGASMGGLVAGFYASGMEAPEMHQLVSGLDWNRLVNGEVDYRKLALRRKQDIRTYGNSTFLGVKGGISLPTGFNSGQGLDLLLARVALPYNQLTSFDDLPTPFRCAATDIVTSQQRLFDKGSLGEALRATMSIPGLFEPVRNGNSMWVDGGLLNNLPVDLVKAMGADIVIAVYLDTDPFDPNKTQSAIQILARSLSAVVAANEKHNIEMADLLVSINLSGYNPLDFHAFEDIISRGFAGTAKRANVLSRFRLNDEQWNAFLQKRAGRRKTEVPPPQFLEVLGLEGSQADVVKEYFADLLNKPLDPAEVEVRVNRVMGTNAFAYMAYAPIERNGKPGLVLLVHQSPGRPPTFQPAVLLDGSDYRNTRFAFAARLTAMNFGGFRSEWRNDVIFGSTYAVRSEYFHPLRPRSSWFIAPNAFAETRPLDFYSRSRVLAQYRARAVGGGFDIGRQFSNLVELRAGYQAAYLVTANRLVGQDVVPAVRGRYGAFQLSAGVDRVDDEVVPHSGVLAQARFRAVDANPGSPEAFPALDGIAAYFHPTSQRGTFYGGAEGGTIFQRANNGVPLYFLGGPNRLSAYGTNELYGNQYVLGRIGYYHQITALSPVSDGRVYVVVNGEVGRMYGSGFSSRTPMDLNAGLVLRTFFGPFLVGAALGDSGHRKVYFQMGRIF